MTRDMLRKIDLDINGDHPFCHNLKETIDYLFKHGDFANYV